jgi:signal transduction histidine kinase
LPAADDELRRLAATLNDMLARLDDSIHAERRLLDNASHELRTPLTALKAELDLARARPRTAAELLAAIESASEEADRVVRLADDLLILARARSGRLTVHRAPTSLGELVGGAANLFRARAETAGVRIDVAAPDDEVLIDGARVRQAIDNLLDNALRCTPAGGAVRLAAEANDKLVRIVVTDTGPGFTDRPDGAGLGLAIVRAIAAGHGGTLTTANESGGGARVVLTLGGVAAPPPPRCSDPDPC